MLFMSTKNKIIKNAPVTQKDFAKIRSEFTDFKREIREENLRFKNEMIDLFASFKDEIISVISRAFQESEERQNKELKLIKNEQYQHAVRINKNEADILMLKEKTHSQKNT